MNQEIKELLEKALDVLAWCKENADEKWMNDHIEAVQIDIDQALAKLRTAPEQPPAGKFTKLARKAIVCLSLAEADEKGNIKDEKGIESSIEVLFRACDRLDTETQRAKAAEAEKQKYRQRMRELENECIEETNRAGESHGKVLELEAKLKDLLEALEEIRDLETDCCPRCEGSGRLWADGKVHFQHEQADTIHCGNCGGSGRILPEDAQDIAESAIKANKKEISGEKERKL